MITLTDSSGTAIPIEFQWRGVKYYIRYWANRDKIYWSVGGHSGSCDTLINAAMAAKGFIKSGSSSLGNVEKEK